MINCPGWRPIDSLAVTYLNWVAKSGSWKFDIGRCHPEVAQKLDGLDREAIGVQ